jgi:hypothetical protein
MKDEVIDKEELNRLKEELKHLKMILNVLDECKESIGVQNEIRPFKVLYMNVKNAALTTSLISGSVSFYIWVISLYTKANAFTDE